MIFRTDDEYFVTKEKENNLFCLSLNISPIVTNFQGNKIFLGLRCTSFIVYSCIFTTQRTMRYTYTNVSRLSQNRRAGYLEHPRSFRHHRNRGCTRATERSITQIIERRTRTCPPRAFPGSSPKSRIIPRVVLDNRFFPSLRTVDFDSAKRHVDTLRVTNVRQFETKRLIASLC